MKRIIVFGATGGIGAYTALHLHESQDYEVIAVGHRKNDNGFYEQYGIKYLSVDIADYKTFEVLPKSDVDTVVNMAGVLPARSYDPRMYIQSFTMGQLNVLEYMREVGCKKIISAQTPADLWYLQNTTEPMPADAQRSFPPSTDHSIYTIAKNAAIDITEYYHNTFGISRFILRFFNVYMYHPNPYYHVDGIKRMISFRLLMDRAEKGEDIEVWGDPTRSKEILYVKDLAQLIQQCVESSLEGGIYNVGSLKQVTLEEQIDGIIEVFTNEKKSKKVLRPDKPDALFNHLDISKTVNELGYSPKYSYIDWLKDFKKEMEENRFEKLWGTRADYED
ncbi:NAD(P)-dependent oxidoreductase [Prevotella copri]|uniref:NAD(P)-dependent oxidoreductase n=1 Tax=Segatella copri TaxID=165179 RepID=A0A6I2TY61_9BACT|nr:NAD(P)-dependent oxidoreductase [Segatella copri]MST78746.1 NAD(P)-dependent oxidoreductase [Segatella copri]